MYFSNKKGCFITRFKKPIMYKQLSMKSAPNQSCLLICDVLNSNVLIASSACVSGCVPSVTPLQI